MWDVIGQWRAEASGDPEGFVRALSDPATPSHRLTYMAEAAPHVLPHRQIGRALVRLLGHPSPVVREGAVLGLATIAETNALFVRIVLWRQLAVDPSPGVRAALRGAIGWFEGDVWDPQAWEQLLASLGRPAEPVPDPAGRWHS